MHDYCKSLLVDTCPGLQSPVHVSSVSADNVSNPFWRSVNVGAAEIDPQLFVELPKVIEY